MLSKVWERTLGIFYPAGIRVSGTMGRKLVVYKSNEIVSGSLLLLLCALMEYRLQKFKPTASDR